jgi:NAD(P)-dependent dehydrogenase (short-subunit alcohol dehydrogenase family)
MNKTVIILGVSADIGRNICKFYLNDGFQVLGTYRNFSESMNELSSLDGLTLFKCDVTQREDVIRFVEFVNNNNIFWSTLLSTVGTSEPIGRFFDLKFDDWENSIQINCLGQLHVLHALHKYRSTGTIPNVVFLAGGGTNNPFRCYSAYCVSKILLIKMCELLDDENPDLNVFIAGPGFVRTKTHLETIKAGELAEENYIRVKEFWESEDSGTSMENIYSCVRWLESKGREIAGGRNFSVVNDKWGDEELAFELSKDINMYKLRRYGNAWGARDEGEGDIK